MQYEKSVTTIETIKHFLKDIFEEIGIDNDTIEKLSIFASM